MNKQTITVKAYYDGYDCTATCPICGEEILVVGPIDGCETCEKSCDHLDEIDSEMATFILEE